MAVNGQLAFPNAAAAKEGTENFARTINRIDLTAMLGRQSKERLYCRDSGRVIPCCDFPELHAIGAVCLASPRTMRDYEVQQVNKHFPQSPFLEWMKTEKYLWFLRLLGIIVCCLGALLAFVLLKRLWETVFI
jgi:hypothetical protein